MPVPGLTMTPHQLTQLRERLVEHFSQEELQLLCADLGACYDDLAGQTISAKAQSLLAQVMADELQGLQAMLDRE